MAGKQVTVYIREEDMEIWGSAQRYARSRRLAMSALVITALEKYMASESGDSEARKPR